MLDIPDNLVKHIQLHQTLYEEKNVYVNKINNKSLKLTPEEQNELQEKINDKLNKLKLNEDEFKINNFEYLKSFKNDHTVEQYGTIQYPTFLTAIWRKVVHNQCDELDMIHETHGRGQSGKFIVIQKKNYDKKESSEESDDSEDPYYRKDPNEPKLDSQDVRCEPDTIVSLSNMSLSYDKELGLLYFLFEITKPDANGAEIDNFNVYQNDYKIPYPNEKIKIQIKQTFLNLRITAQNRYGESEKSKEFKFQFNFPKNQKVIYSGNNEFEQVVITQFLHENQQTDIEIKKLNMVELKTFNGVLNDFKSQSTTLLLDINGKIGQCGNTLYCEDESVNIVQKDTKSKLLTSVEQITSSLFFPPQETIFKAISVGRTHSAALSVDGKVYTWGLNTFGQLGLGDRYTRLRPTLVAELQNVFITQIVGKYDHMMALDDKGKVYSWGKQQALAGKPIKDRFGMSFDFENTGVDQLLPRQIKEVIDYYQVKKIDCGLYHNACLTSKNELYVWGHNDLGQLGIQNLDEPIKATCIPRKLEFSSPVCDIACGMNYNLVLTVEGEHTVLYSFGQNANGQLGLGDKSTKQTNNSRLTPQKVSAFEGKEINFMSAGDRHSLVNVQDEGTYGFGKNKRNCLGTNEKELLKPKIVCAVNNQKDVFAGYGLSIFKYI